MKLFSVCFLCAMSATTAATLSGKSQTGSPVERVVTLLKDLASQIETDEKAETQMYNKYACWCETTTKRKAADIDNGLADMRSLSQEILSLKGNVATYTSEIAELTSDIAKADAEMEEATSLRSKENSAFMAESAEMKNALAALQSAIKVLTEATLPGAALMQEETQTRSRMAVRAVLDTLPSRVALPVDRMSLLGTFTNAHSAYAPQSATIQGLLADMYTTFSTDLEESTSVEATKNKNYEDLMAVKTKAKKDMSETKAAKEAKLAEAGENLAEASKTYDDTYGQKEADILFFDETKKSCTAKSDEWTLRQKLRGEELAGIEEAIKILTSDDARDTFKDAIKPGKETGLAFFQLSDESNAGAPSVQAYNVLKAQASQSHNIRLAQLAVRVRNAKVGHFDGVIKAIDSMMATLKSEGADDLAKKTQCLDEYQRIDLSVDKLSWKISVNEATIGKLEKKIEKKTKAKDATVAEIQENSDHLVEIGKIRSEQNEEFKKAKADDVKAVALLKDARTKLAAYYHKQGVVIGPIQGSVKGASLSQQDPVFDVSEDQAPDANFSSKGSRKGEAKDIVSLMSYLIEDLQDEITNGNSTEESQEAAYQEEKTAAENLGKKLTAKKISLEEAISKAGRDKVAEGELKSENEGAKLAEETTLKDIKPDCDWILGAFDKRAEARASEMEGLTQAKEYLAGSAFLQKAGKGFLGQSH